MHVLKSVLNLPIFSLHLFVDILSVGGRLNSTQLHFQLDALLFYTQSLSSSSNLNTLTYYTPDVSTSLCCRYYVFSSGKSIRSVMPCLPMKSWVSVWECWCWLRWSCIVYCSQTRCRQGLSLCLTLCQSHSLGIIWQQKRSFFSLDIHLSLWQAVHDT